MKSLTEVLQHPGFVNLARLLCQVNNAEITIIVKNCIPIYCRHAVQTVHLEQQQEIDRARSLIKLVDEFNAAVTPVTKN